MKSPVSLHVVLVAGWTLVPLAASAQPAGPPPPEQTPLVEVYGTLVPFLEFGHTTSATPAGSLTPGMDGASQVATYSGVNQPARFRMDPSTTNIGFRGGIELMPNLSVVWQIENAVPIDGAAAAVGFASRNTNVGLTGSWGTLFYGNWDTPYAWTTKTLINPIRSGNVTDYNSIIDNPGFGIASVTSQVTRSNAGPDAAFERRQGNSVQYWTPNISGFAARFDYSGYEGRNAATPMAPSIKPTVFGASLSFDMGPLKLREAVDVHLDYFGMSQIGGSPGDTVTNRSSTDWGNKVVAQFTNEAKGFDTRVVGIFEYLSYKNKDTTMLPGPGMLGAITEFSRPAVYGLIDQTLMGKHHIWLGAGKAFQGSCARFGGGDCSTEGLGATDFVLGYIYRMSKSTDFWAAAYRISNEASASYTTSPSLTAPAVTAPGTMVEAFGVGILYTFSAKIIGPPTKPAVAPPPPPTTPTPAPTTEPGPVPPPTAPEATPTPAAPGTPTNPPPPPTPHG